MSDDDLHLAASKQAKNLISDVLRGVKSTASVEVVGKAFDGLISVRDITANLLAVLSDMPLSSDQIRRLKSATTALSDLQETIGESLPLIARDAFGEIDEPKA